MNRPRKKNKHLPPCVYQKHGAYYYVRAGQWIPIGKDLRNALRAHAELHGQPRGTIGALFDVAMPHILKDVAPSTRKMYRRAEGALRKIFAEFEPHQVQPKHVAAMKLARAEKAGATNHLLTVGRLVFNFALEQQLISANPFVGVKRVPQSPRDRLLTADEYAAIHAKAAPRLQVIMDLLILTGQRVMDVVRLRRDALTDEGIYFRQGKTGRKLIVRWTPELRAAIECAKALHGNVHSLHLFRSRVGGGIPAYKSIQEQWRRTCAAAGVENAHLHDLRAYALTQARREGKDATALAGHSSQAMTNRYLRDRSATLVEGPSFRQSNRQRLDTSKK